MAVVRARAPRHSDHGAGTVLVVCLVAVVVSVGLAVVTAGASLARGQQLSAAADAAALAAADVLLGWVAGEPCEVAERLAAAHHAVVRECVSDGIVVTVRVDATVLGFTVERSARAGPR